MLFLNEKWAGTGLASFMVICTMAKQIFPRQFETYVTKYTRKIFKNFYPYIVITFSEYSGERFKRSEAYTSIESYLSGTCTDRAKRLKADIGKDSRDLLLSMDEHEEVTDEFQGVRVKWHAIKSKSTRQSFSIYPATDDHRKYYTLVFHQSFRKIISGSYLQHVMEHGKAMQLKKRQRMLYTNGNDDSRRKQQWSHVPFEHPATFDTVAINPSRKQEIVEDLLAFSKSKDYYLKVGKPWKRGYLLYGPPGTGKSTMIAAMANLMDYDVYDLELTAVKDNTGLKKLLIETTSKSIIVIEDIDCSLDLSGKRKMKKDGEKSEKLKEKMEGKSDKDDTSKVTLSGLLNSIDGLWSACVSERLIVFTTNYVEKLDQALIRRGRMDMHIELSYCRFEAFKVLAKNYLSIDDHELFEEIKELMEKKDITPADVAENLMPKTLARVGDRETEKCLNDLIRALNECKTKSEVEEHIKEVKAKGIKDRIEEKVEEVGSKDTKDKVEQTEQVKTKDEVQEIKLETSGEIVSSEDAS